MKRDLRFLLLCVAVLPLFVLGALALLPVAVASSQTAPAQYKVQITSLSSDEQIVLMCAPITPVAKESYK